MSFDLTNKNIKDTYQSLLQKTGSGNQLYDLVGNPIEDLTIQGALHAQSYIVSESIVAASSGSTQFGNSSDDTHKFSGSLSDLGGGSLKVSGDLSASGDIYVGTTKVVDANLINLTSDGKTTISGSFTKTSSSLSTRTSTLESNVGQAVNTASNVTFNNISASGAIHTLSHITASGNISASGTSTGSFGHVQTGEIRVNDITMTGGARTINSINNLYIQNNIIHESNPGTKIAFDTDKITLAAGYTDMITFTEDANNTNIALGAAISTDITASGHISASGGISASSLHVGSNKLSVEGTSIVNQDLTTDTNPTFDKLTLTNDGGANALILNSNASNVIKAEGIGFTLKSGGTSIISHITGSGAGALTLGGGHNVDIALTGETQDNLIRTSATNNAVGIGCLPTNPITGFFFPSGIFNVVGSSFFHGSITSSGNISASGDIYGGDLYASTWKADTEGFPNKITMAVDNRIDLSPNSFTVVRLSDSLVTLNKDTNVNGHITASGDISSSGIVHGQIFKSFGQNVATLNSDQMRFGNTTNETKIFADNEIILGNNIEVTGHITASGNISASGTLIANALILDESAVFNNDNTTSALQIKGQTDDSLFLANVNSSGIDKIGIGGASFPSKLSITGDLTTTSHITSSGNISASGDIYSSEVYLDNYINFYYGTSDYHSIKMQSSAVGEKVGFGFLSGSTTLMQISHSVGNPYVGIGTKTPPKTLTVQGDISASGDFLGKSTSTGSFGEIKGAPIWVDYPFIMTTATYDRYHFRDVDELNSTRKWDAYDTTPTAFDYRGVAGQYVIPEDCTLTHMRGIVSNTGISTVNPTIYIFYGTITEGTGTTTLASASNGTEPSIGTARVPHGFSEDFDLNLSAGQIVVPMIKHSFSGATQGFQGNITLRYKTR